MSKEFGARTGGNVAKSAGEMQTLPKDGNPFAIGTQFGEKLGLAAQDVPTLLAAGDSVVTEVISTE